MSTFLSGSINVSQAILGTSESGLMSYQHYMQAGYKQIQIKLYIKPISVFMILIVWLVIPQCRVIFDSFSTAWLKQQER